VEYIAANAGAKLVLADAEFAAAVANLPATVLLDDAAQADTTPLSGKYPPAPMQVCKPNDLFRLMYTSGTTDRPKGVIHTYDNFYWKSIDHVIALGLGEDDRLLVAGPLSVGRALAHVEIEIRDAAGARLPSIGTAVP
jgi:fatty-acyl-CoA synthase